MNVYISKKLALRIVKTATMTLVDMVCNVGGAVGLFCGFSILSGVEALFWGGRALVRMFVFKNKQFKTFHYCHRLEGLLPNPKGSKNELVS